MLKFIHNVEWKILDLFDKCECDFLNLVNQYLSEIFGSLGIVIILFIIYWCISKEKGTNIAFTLFFTMLTNNLLKGLIARKRPFERPGREYIRKLDSAKDGATSSSFPSGHSMNAAGFYGSLIVNYRARRFRSLQIVSLVIICVVGLSRVYLGVHFPSDVAAGILFGLMIAFGIGFLQELLGDKKIILYVLSLIIFLPCLFIEKFDRDFFKSYGMMAGFVLGYILEAKFVDFTTAVGWLKKVLRVLLGIVVVGGVYLIYNIVPDAVHNNEVFTMFMHLLISFSGIFLVPFIFRTYEKKMKA